MAHRRSFDRDYLRQEFEKLDNIANKGIALYLIGGGAISAVPCG